MMKKSGYTPFKMKGKSPMMKKLIGNQHRLPEELKAKILASPTKMMKKSPAKEDKMKRNRDKINPFSAEYKRMTPKQKREAREGNKLQGSGKDKITVGNIKKSLGKTKKKVEDKLNTLNKAVQGEAGKLDKFLKKDKTLKLTPKKNQNQNNPSKKNNNKKGPIDWSSAPAVGTKARTKWYKDNNLALDDTTPALMKKSAMKMKKAPAKMKKAPAKMMKKSAAKMKKESMAKLKKSPAKLIKKKTDREKLNKLVEKRTKLNKKKDEREAKGKKTKRVTKRIQKTQKKINKNPKAQEDLKKSRKKKNVEQMMTDFNEKMMDFLMKEPVRKMKRERGEPVESRPTRKRDHLRPQKRRTSKR